MSIKKSSTGKIIAVIGLLFQLAPFIGFGVTVIGMISAFDTLSASGTANPSTLSVTVTSALISTAIGLMFGFIGLFLIGYALFFNRFRATWFFWMLIVVSFLWIINFPVGTLIGGGLLAYLFIQRNEFKRNIAYDKRTTPIGSHSQGRY